MPEEIYAAQLRINNERGVIYVDLADNKDVEKLGRVTVIRIKIDAATTMPLDIVESTRFKITGANLIQV